MASLIELAELSKAAYDDAGDVGIDHGNQTRSWQRLRVWYHKLGFHASEFADPSGEIVVAFRGTNDGWDGVIDDVAIAAGSIPPQAAAAIQITADSQADYFTGHSLGGALALIAGASRNKKAVTFNAPGVMDSCTLAAVLELDLGMVGRCTVKSKAINVRIEWDPVSSGWTTGMQSGGRDLTLEAPECGVNSLCRHGIQTVIDALRRQDGSFDEVPRD